MKQSLFCICVFTVLQCYIMLGNDGPYYSPSVGLKYLSGSIDGNISNQLTFDDPERAKLALLLTDNQIFMFEESPGAYLQFAGGYHFDNIDLGVGIAFESSEKIFYRSYSGINPISDCQNNDCETISVELYQAPLFFLELAYWPLPKLRTKLQIQTVSSEFEFQISELEEIIPATIQSYSINLSTSYFMFSLPEGGVGLYLSYGIYYFASSPVHSAQLGLCYFGVPKK